MSMDLELASESEWILELIINVFVPAVAAIAGFAVVALAGVGAWAAVQRVAQLFRPQVDEADDWLVLTLDGIGEAVLHRELDEAYISKLLTAMVDAIGKPPQEVAIGDTPK
jgi:hypothetical protein